MYSAVKVSGQPSWSAIFQASPCRTRSPSRRSRRARRWSSWRYGGLAVEFAAPDAYIEFGAHLRSDQRGGQQLVLGVHRGFELGQVEGDIGADHESCHGVLCEARFGELSATPLIGRVVVVDRSLEARLWCRRRWRNSEQG